MYEHISLVVGTTEELLMSLLNRKHADKIQHGKNPGETYLKKKKINYMS